MTKHHPLCFLLACTLTFLLMQFPTSNSQEITFVEEPKDNYYIVKKRPVTITCAARHAVDMSFTCGGTKVPPTSVELEDMSEDDPEVVRASISVTRNDVNHYKKQGNFWCECNAIGIDGQVAATSKKGDITNAIFKYRFKTQPTTQRITAGENVEFVCEPPISHPKPEIFWKKNKRRINMKMYPRYTVSDAGSLIIESATAEDSGTYQCVAKSPAGRRESKGADLVVAFLVESAEPEEEVSREDSSDGAKSREERQTDKPFFSTQPKALYYIKPEETLTIDCGVTSANVITFRCNEQRQNRQKQDTSQGQDSNGNRIIQSQLKLTYNEVLEFYLSKGNNTSYQCQCVGWYQQGEKKWETILSEKTLGVVKLAYLEENFKREPSDVIVGVNMQARLPCEPPKGQPNPWVYWFKDNVKIDPRSDTSYRVSREGHLIILSAEYSDSGRYKCVAENIVKKVESKLVELRVTADPPPPTTPTTTIETTGITMPEFPPDEPVFLKDLPDETELNKKGIATLTCITIAAQMLSIDCNKRRLSQEEFTVVREQKSGMNMITLTTEVGSGDVASSPDGYFCRCTAWHLDSLGKWKQFHGNNGYVVEEEKQAYIGDQFVYPPKDIEVQFETAVEIPCEPPEGYPMPKVYWLKDGNMIKPDEDTNFVVLQAGTLVVEYTRVEDAGMYVCVAENEAGTRRADPIKLNVLGLPPTNPPAVETTYGEMSSTMDYETTTFHYMDSTYTGPFEPFFTLEPEAVSYIINSGQSVTLSCTVYAARVLIFACNGEILKETATTGFVTKDHTGHDIRENSLTITARQVEEYQGSEPYSCVCKGIAQREETGEQYSVDSRPGIIQRAYLKRNFIKEPESKNVMLGKEVTLMCSPPDGVPTPELSWIKDGYHLSETENHVVNDDGSLTIRSVVESDEGEYTCAAANLMGKRTSQSVKISIKTSDSMMSTSQPEPEPETTQYGEATAEPTPDDVVTPSKGTTYISKDLHSVYYVIKNNPVKILCEATGATDISFTCGGQEVTTDVYKRASFKEVFLDDGTKDNVNVIEGVVTVSRDDVEDYLGEYFCVCKAFYDTDKEGDMGYIESQHGYVELAYLKKRFVQEPKNVRVMEGKFLMVLCLPPQGNPSPKVTWMKDGEPFENMNLAPDGAITIEAVTLEDGGEYVCVAENIAATRMSAPILVEILAGTGMTTPDNMKETGMDGDTTTDDSEIEVEEITKVPLTSDTTDEQTTTYMDMSSKAPMIPDTTDEQPTNMDTKAPMTKDTADEQTTNMDISTKAPMTTETADEQTTNMDISTKAPMTTDTADEQTTNMDISTEVPMFPDTSDEQTTNMDISTAYGVDLVDTSSMSGKMTYPTPEPSIPTQDSSFSTTGEMESLWTSDEPQVNKEDTTEDVTEIELSTTTQMNYPEETTFFDSSTYDMNINKGITQINEYQICVDMMNKCQKGFRQITDEMCKKDNPAVACVTEVLNGCQGVMAEETMEQIRNIFNQVKEYCRTSAQLECPQMQMCQQVYQEQISEMDANSGLPLNLFCRDINNFMQCADQTLSDCDVTMSAPMKMDKSSYIEISDWFSDYCDRFVLKDTSLESCDVMTGCDLSIQVSAGSDNSSYWCSMADNLLLCTYNSVKACGLSDLEDDIKAVSEMRYDISCKKKDMKEEKGKAKDMKEEKGKAKASKDGENDKDNENGASSIGVSTVVLTLIQVALAIFITHQR